MIGRTTPLLTMLVVAACASQPPSSRPARGSSGAPGPARTPASARTTAPLDLSSVKGPERAPMWRLPGGPAAENAVRGLARALGAGTAPARYGTAWSAGGLHVSGEPGQPWTFRAGVHGRPATPDEAKAAAARFARTERIATGAFTVTVAGAVTTVRADPMVGGLPTAGLPLELGVVAGGRIASGSGWLGRPERGPVVAVAGARQAYESLLLARGGRVAPSGARCPEVEQEACTPGRRGVTVTGVRYGLSVVSLRDSLVLAPSWLFTTERGATIPQVAVPGLLAHPRS